jgi:hypothetical protein
LWCFWAPHAEKRPKTRLKKNRWEKTTGKKFFFLNFFRPKAFDMYFPKKKCYGVFELPLLRNAQKRHKTNLKIKKKKKPTYLPHLVAICQIYGGFNLIFLGHPLALRLKWSGPRPGGLALRLRGSAGELKCEVGMLLLLLLLLLLLATSRLSGGAILRGCARPHVASFW